MVSRDSLQKIKQDVENYVFKESDTDNKLSYGYADLVTNTLELSLPSGEPIARYDFSTPKYARL